MANVSFKRGLSEDLENLPIEDGQIMITTDKGELYIDLPSNNTIIRKLIVSGKGIEFEVVQQLPTTNIKTNVIYLVPINSPESQNYYDEFVYCNNQWEKIGNTKTTPVDQTYNPTSENAQSGMAVAQAASNKIDNADGFESKTFSGTKSIYVSLAEKLQDLEISLSTRNILYLPYDNNTDGLTPSVSETVSANGVTFKANSNGSITIWGSLTDSSVTTRYHLRNYYSNATKYTRLDLAAGTYTLSLYSEQAIGATVRFFTGDDFAYRNHPKSITLSNDSLKSFFIQLTSEFSATQENPVTIYPMLESGSIANGFTTAPTKGDNPSSSPAFPITTLTLHQDGMSDIEAVSDSNSITINNGNLQNFTMSTDMFLTISFECNVIKNPRTTEKIIEQCDSAANGVTPLNSYSSTFNLGDKITLEALNMIKKNDQYIFIANITEMGIIVIQHGVGLYNSGDISISSTHVVVRTYTTDYTVRLNEAHNLTFDDYVGVVVTRGNNNFINIKIFTNGGTYTKQNVYWGVSNGSIEVENQGGTYTNATFSYNCNDYKKPIWAFGDSYFDFENGARWTKYLIDWEFDNFLADGYPGATSQSVYPDFVARLSQGKPKYAVWCLGMNNADTSSAINSSWLEYVNKFIDKCYENGIEPILATIPNCPTINHTFKNEWVRTSGYRYIDFAAAVGASEYPSSWYSGMLYTDNVHPTSQGAIALAMRAISDIPEFLQK